MGPIFNEKIAESEVCVSCKQYARPTCVAKKWLKSQIVWLKNKKIKKNKQTNKLKIGRAHV